MTTVGADDRWAATLPSVPGFARPPEPVGESRWEFPPATAADDDGVVGIGADLAPSTLVHAYRNGIFPWPHARMPLPWFSPDPRGLITPTDLHVSRSLRQRLRRSGWLTTVDVAFAAVIANCAQRPRREGTWITPAMQRAYTQLHHLGWAHSVEVWDGPALVGGLYGVQVGGCFTGESMFHRSADASKVALADLAQRFDEVGGSVIDVQLVTPHLATLGARELPRPEYLALLTAVRDRAVRLPVEARPVARLAAR